MRTAGSPSIALLLALGLTTGAGPAFVAPSAASAEPARAEAEPGAVDAVEGAEQPGDASPGAPPAEDGALALQVRRLVRGLNAAELATREKSEADLLALGPRALDLLPAINERMPPEVKHRLTRVRQKMERAEAEGASQPTKITLAGKGRPLAELLAQIEKQTGNRLIDFRGRFGQGAAPLALDVDLKEVEFWPAVDRLLDDAGLSIYPFAGESALALIARDEGVRPRVGQAAYAGPLRIAAVRIEAQRDLRNPANQALRLLMEVAWEPRLVPIALAQPLASIKAVDDRGRPLETASQVAELQVPVQEGTTAVELQLPFALPERGALKIARLSGKMRALLPGRQETFTFADLADAARRPADQPLEQRRGGVRVSLDSVRERNELWEIRLRVTFDAASGALDSHRGWIFKNACYLQGPDGKPIDYAGFETTRQTESEVGLAYLFEREKGLDDCALVYKTPAAIVSLPVEYTLQDIPLP